MFNFKKFSVRHECCFKIGTDSLLLGAWCKVKKSKNVLDIGTGTGVLALMIAQKTSAKIDAIEINHTCFSETQENIIQSPYSSRITISNTDLMNFCSNKLYDFIICNPPYFKNSTLSITNSSARHQTNLSYESLANAASKLLNNTGRMSIVVPYSESKNVLINFGNNGLYADCICQVRHTLKSDFSIQMIQFTKNSGNCAYENLTIHNLDNTKTMEYNKMLSPFLDLGI